MKAPMRENAFGCGQADAVVAHFLDGTELQGLDYLQREELLDHLSSCAHCDDALNRARKLDARVAAESRALIEEPDQAKVDDWFLNAFVEDEPVEEPEVPVAEAGARFDGRVLYGLLAVAAIGLLAVGYVVGRAGDESTDVRVRPRVADRASNESGVVRGPVAQVDPEGAGPSGPERPSPNGPGRPGIVDFRVGDGEARRFSERRTPIANIDLAAAVEHPLTPVLLQGARGLSGQLAAWTGNPEPAERLRGLLDRSLDRAVARLADQRGRAAEDALFVLAVRDENASARRVLESRMRSWLRRVPADPRARRLAAEFGGRQADRALLDWAVGDLARSDEVSNHLRVAGDRDGTVTMLLELWRVLDRRSGLDPVATAERWFAGRSDSCAAQVVEALDESPNGEERQRLILAAAALRSPMASDAMQKRMTGGNRDEGLLAAYALGRMPARSDGLIDLDPRRRDLALWRTVLLSRRDPIVDKWLADLPASAEELEMLRAGGFSLDQVPVVMRLLEENGLGARSRRGY